MQGVAPLPIPHKARLFAEAPTPGAVRALEFERGFVSGRSCDRDEFHEKLVKK